MTGKNQKYQMGHIIGRYLGEHGESYSPKDIDAEVEGMIEDTDWKELPIEYGDEDFKDGVWNGYTLQSDISEGEVKKKGR